MPDTVRGDTYYDIANAFYKLSQLDSARFYLESSRRYYRKGNDLVGLGDYNTLSGSIRRSQGLFDEAVMHYQSALMYFTKSKRPASVAKVYSNLALLYKSMGENQRVRAQLEQGIVYVRQAIAINEAYNIPQQLVGNYINLGIIYEDLNEFARGKECFLKALAINDKIKARPEEYTVIYNNLGKNLNQQGQYEQAIAYLNKALALNLKFQRTTSIVHNYRNLTTSYSQLKQPELALQYGEKARTLVEASKDAPLTCSVYRTLARTYASVGQYDKAYQYLVRQKQLEDSLMTLEKTQAIAQLEGRYEVQKANELAKIAAAMEVAKTREIVRLETRKAREIAFIQAEEKERTTQISARADVEKTKALAELQTKYETQKRVRQISELGQQNQLRIRQIQYMAGGLLLLALLLSVLIFQYRFIRRANHRLAAQNALITSTSRQLSQQSEQLALMMKELHHRVKNNLAIISSLLKLQSNRLEDEKALQAVRAGQQRVEAMSLIHQRLYQTDRLQKVNIKDYLSDLANSLMKAYGYPTNDFDLSIEVDSQDIDVDIAMPLGLIANELITNALKYAYSSDRRPYLRLSLRNQNGFIFEVQDNGPGVTLTDWQKKGQRSSFGKRLISSLSEQLDAHFELIKQDGTLFRLYIPSTFQQSA